MLREALKRFAGPILALLRQGLSPNRAALAVALGLWIGVIPIVLGTMLLCALVAWALRLNHVIIQTVCLTVFPLQVLLLYPFFDLGTQLMHGPHLRFNAAELATRVRVAPWALLKECWWLGIHATIIWAAMGLVIVPLLWAASRVVFRRVGRPSTLP